MKALTLTMPRLGETMDEGLIVGWMVAPGESFRRGQPILELETDKTVVEFPALGEGVIDEALAGPGDRIAVGAPIARARVADAAEWADAAETAAGAGTAPAAGPSVLRMPRLGETMEEGIVVQWLLAEGAAYGRGEAILEIETDKTVAEVPALYEGRLLRILAGPGEKLPVGAPLAEVEGEVEPVAPAAAAPAAAAPAPAAPPRAAGTRPRATPLARRLARQKSISLEQVAGSGRRGRIERADVERAAAGGAPSAILAAGDMCWLETPAGRVAYAAAGSGGRVHLLLHGFAGDRSAWAATMAAIARAGHTAVAPDLPGHGATAVEAADIGTLAEAAAQIAETLPGPLTLVGHSLGAAVAVAVAGRLGPRATRLVLLTPAGCGPLIGAGFVHGMARAQTPGEVAHLLRLLGPKGGALSDAALAQMAAAMAKGRLTALAGALATPEGRQRLDILRPLAALDMPVTAVFGTDDRVVPASDALNLPVNVAAHFLPTGHMPQWDAPREVTDLILNGGRHG